MSIFGSMKTAVSGMNAQANRLSTVADNIANVNTSGYKAVSTSFSSLVLPSSGDRALVEDVVGVRLARRERIRAHVAGRFLVMRESNVAPCSVRRDGRQHHDRCRDCEDEALSHALSPFASRARRGWTARQGSDLSRCCVPRHQPSKRPRAIWADRDVIQRVCPGSTSHPEPLTSSDRLRRRRSITASGGQRSRERGSKGSGSASFATRARRWLGGGREPGSGRVPARLRQHADGRTALLRTAGSDKEIGEALGARHAAARVAAC